ncbi:MAG: hypothetical protein KAT77_03120 [Nanoarchaeota archaeon]|nr:hypothetical protein [Nanoarchaeota archaeon]
MAEEEKEEGETSDGESPEGEESLGEGGAGSLNLSDLFSSWDDEGEVKTGLPKGTREVQVSHLGTAEIHKVLPPEVAELVAQDKAQAKQMRLADEAEERIKEIEKLDLDVTTTELEEQIKSPDDAFVYVVNKIPELKSQVRALEVARQKLEAAEEGRKEIDKQFMKTLEAEGINFSLRLRSMTDSGRSARIDMYEGYLKTHLENHYSGGFTIKESSDLRLQILFDDIGVAIGFYKYLSTQRTRFDEEISALYAGVCQELEDRGLKAAVLEEGAELTGVTGAAKRRATGRITEAAIVGLKSLDKDELAKKVLDLDKKIEKLKKEKPEDLSETYTKERAAAQERIDMLSKGMETLENHIKTSSIEILQSFQAVGNYLRDNKEICDFGNKIPEDAKPGEYLKLVSEEAGKISSKIERLVEDKIKFKLGQELIQEQVLELKDIVQRYFKIASNEYKRFESLFSDVMGVHASFWEYVAEFKVEGFEGLKRAPPSLMATEDLINVYLGILDQGIALVETEMPVFYDELVRVYRKRDEVIRSYNCGSLKELEEKLTELNENLEMIKDESELKIEMKKSQRGEEGSKYEVLDDMFKEMQRVGYPQEELKLLVQKLDSSVDKLAIAKKLGVIIGNQLEELKAREDHFPEVDYGILEKKFEALAKLGQFYGVEIDSRAQLVGILQEEKEKYEACKMCYKLLNGVMLENKPKSL